MPTLRIAHLYPRHLNMYGDRGNVQALWVRAAKRGIPVEVVGIEPGDWLSTEMAEGFDLFFMGGGQDRQQWVIAEDLLEKKAAGLRHAILQTQSVMLGICGGYQLMGHYYQPPEGPRLPGMGLLDLTTVAGDKRLIGNCLVRVTLPDGGGERLLVGFENHGGKTLLGPSLQPLGQVVSGYGNNGEDGGEGVLSGTMVGSYLHGSLLPKNAWLTDWLLGQALAHACRREGGAVMALPELPSVVEDQAARMMVAKLTA